MHAGQTGNTTIVVGRDVNSQAAQVIASGDIGIGSQAVDIARTAGQINAINAGKAELGYEPGKDATKEDWVEYNKKLAATESYKAEEQKWGTGGAIQQGISAATMALQGLAGGDVKAAIAGGAAP